MDLVDDNDDDACDCIGDNPSIECSSRWSVRLLFFTSLFLSHYTFKLTKSSLLKGHLRDPNWICSSSSFTPLILLLLPDFVGWFPRNFRLLDSFKHDDTYSYGTNLIDGTSLLLPFAYKKSNLRQAIVSSIFWFKPGFSRKDQWFQMLTFTFTRCLDNCDKSTRYHF